MNSSVGQAKLFVSTGCSSSDNLLAPVLNLVRRRGIAGQIKGIGGEPLRENGVELLFDSTPLSTIGTAHGAAMFFRSGWNLLRAFRAVKKLFREDPPDLVVLVDNAGINFRIMSIAHRAGIPVLYYVPPELWSVWWFEVGILQKARPRAATIFSSQNHEYQSLGLDALWFGHPILDLIKDKARAPESVEGSPTVGIFPGSRRQELLSLLDPMRDAAEHIHRCRPDARFVLCAANSLARDIIQSKIATWKVPVEIRYREAYRTLAESHVALACSGTVTLEAALLGVPIVAMYRLAGVLDNLIQKLFLPKDTYKFFSLPNLIASRPIVTELANREVNGPRIAQEVTSLLENGPRRQKLIQDLKSIAPMLGEPGAIARTAQLIEQMLDQSKVGTRHAA